jgi:ABC-type multidrug transport system ATPase subunit
MLRGLSGGERKRLSIATALLSDPAIVFLDEPTSGLDSFAALSVTQHMREIADQSQTTVIASIHQPGPAIWTLFDRVSEEIASGHVAGAPRLRRGEQHQQEQQLRSRMAVILTTAIEALFSRCRCKLNCF